MSVTNQNKVQAGITWPVFVTLWPDDRDPVRLALHNVLSVLPYKNSPATHTCIKTRGTHGNVIVIAIPFDQVRAQFDAALDASTAAVAGHMARAIVAISSEVGR
jgi:hypothetical protein